MRVMDKNMTTTNSALTWHGTRDRLAASARDQLSRGRVQSPLIARVNQPLPTHPSPLLLSPDQAMRLKTALLHGEAHLTAELRALVDPELVLALNALHAPSQPLISDTAARALLVAKYFGNLDEIRFWTLVLYFMEKVLLNKEYYSTDRARDEVEGKEMLHPHWSLPECYDLLRDNEDLKRTHPIFSAPAHQEKKRDCSLRDDEEDGRSLAVAGRERQGDRAAARDQSATPAILPELAQVVSDCRESERRTPQEHGQTRQQSTHRRGA
jgi:hypothetical protein